MNQLRFSVIINRQLEEVLNALQQYQPMLLPEQGDYSFPALLADEYKMSVEAASDRGLPFPASTRPLEADGYYERNQRRLTNYETKNHFVGCFCWVGP